MINSPLVKHIIFMEELGSRYLSKFLIYLETNTKRPELIELFCHVKKYRNKKHQLTREIILNQAFKNPVGSKRLSVLLYDLNEIAKDFLANKYYGRHEIDQLRMLAKLYKSMGEKASYRKIADNILKLYKPDVEYKWYLEKSELYHAIYYEFPTDKSMTSEEYEDVLREEFLNLQIYCTLKELIARHEMLNRSTWEGMALKDQFNNETQQFCLEISSEIKKIPIVSLYMQAIELSINKSITVYQTLKIDYFIQFKNLQISKSTLMVSLLNNLLLVDYPDNKIAELCELYEIALEYKLFVKNKSMDVLHFDNIVFTFCQSGKHLQAKEYMIGYKKYVPESVYSLTNFFFECQLLFHEKKFLEVRAKLKANHGTSLSYISRSIPLDLKSLFEIDKAEIHLVSERYRHLLKTKYDNNELSKVVHDRIMNFIKLIKKMANPEDDSRYSKSRLNREFEKYKDNVMEKEWLFEKINKRKR